MLKLCLSIVLLGLVSHINGANVPVFMWGQETYVNNKLSLPK